jgi:4'-phosphopantetheinyl transferase
MPEGRDLTVHCSGPEEAQFVADPSDLVPGMAQIWFARLEEMRDHIPEYRALLDEEESARADRFRFDVDRERYIIGHGMLRMLLSRYTGIAPKEIRTDRGKYGKPYLPDGSLHFNLSDTKDAVLIAFALEEIGADLETMARTVDHQAVAEHYFTSAEVEWIQGGDEPKRRFLELWTRKEAVLKASGVGIMDDLRVLEVHGSCNTMRISHDAFVADAAQEYVVRTWRLGEEHVVSLAGGAGVWGEFVSILLRNDHLNGPRFYGSKPATFSDLPGWTFEIDEVSAGVYQVLGKNHGRPWIDLRGFDEEELLSQALAKARDWEKL